MKKAFLLFISIVFCQLGLSAKKLDSLSYTEHKEFYLHWDNDLFLFKDFYYTQGAFFYYVNPSLRKNPANHILFRLKNADNYYGLGLIQEIYTPKDITDTLLNLVDRPYAGTLFLRSFSVSSNPKKLLKLTSQFDIGVMGPLAGAYQAQRYIHEWLDLGWPNGWDFQIENRPYINYNLQIEKGAILVPGKLDVMADTRLRIGNIHDDLKVGGKVRIGRLNNHFKGHFLSNKKYAEEKDLQAYLYGGFNLSAVLYNATLMGGIIPPGENHYFAFNEIENIVGEVYGGIFINYKFMGASARLNWKSKEFELGEKHGWGTVSVYFRL